ncbi:MAG: PspA/IM30 family protein [Anaerolineae bacterium]|nr:PspA/IM30 family protein [Gloeobacterales cyanobacterium ES-bin-313]
MGLFDRITNVLKSNINAAVTKAEDPEKMLNQTVNDMQEDLVSLRQAVAQAIASQKRFEQQYQQAQSQADEWQRRAALAVSKNNDELAREALSRKKSFSETAVGLKSSLEQQNKTVSTLKTNLTALEGKISEAKAKKDLLVARARSAKATEQINTTLGKINTTGSFSTFERMEEKVNELEARSQAVAELSTDNLEDQFKSLEAGGGVEDELLALKAQMGTLPPAAQKALPESQTPS